MGTTGSCTETSHYESEVWGSAAEVMVLCEKGKKFTDPQKILLPTPERMKCKIINMAKHH